MDREKLQRRAAETLARLILETCDTIEKDEDGKITFQEKFDVAWKLSHLLEVTCRAMNQVGEPNAESPSDGYELIPIRHLLLQKLGIYFHGRTAYWKPRK